MQHLTSGLPSCYTSRFLVVKQASLSHSFSSSLRLPSNARAASLCRETPKQRQSDGLSPILHNVRKQLHAVTTPTAAARLFSLHFTVRFTGCSVCTPTRYPFRSTANVFGNTRGSGGPPSQHKTHAARRKNKKSATIVLFVSYTRAVGIYRIPAFGH